MADSGDNRNARPKQLLLLANKNSGQGGAGLEQAVGVFEKAGCGVTVVYTESIEDLRNRIAEAGGAMVVLAGGDGSMNAAAPALLEAGQPFGIIPMGTANDLARTLGIPPDPAQAAAIILKGHRRHIDLGRVNGKPFFNVASLGLSSEVARQHGGEMKRRLGIFNYPLSLWRAYRDHRPFTAEMAFDGEVLRCRCTQVAVGNGRHYGGGLTISERAEIDDGWLRVYYLRPVGILGLLRLFPAIRLGRLDRARDTAIRRARRIEVRTKRPRTINVDGELLAETPARFDVLVGALEVLAPEAKSEATSVARKDEVMNLLRSDRRLALQDLVEVCRAAEQYYKTAAPMLNDSALGERLMRLARARGEKADFFAERMAKNDDVTSGPPEEKVILEAMITKAKTVLKDDDTETILADCASYERAVLDQAVGAQDATLEETEQREVAALAADAQDQLEQLFGNSV